MEAVGAESRNRESAFRSRLFALLAQHPSEADAGSCIHLDAFGYGTRSSTRVHLLGNGEWRIEHADGPPCSSDYHPVTWTTAPLRTSASLG